MARLPGPKVKKFEISQRPIDCIKLLVQPNGPSRLLSLLGEVPDGKFGKDWRASRFEMTDTPLSIKEMVREEEGKAKEKKKKKWESYRHNA